MNFGRRSTKLCAGGAAIALTLTGVIGMAASASAGENPYATVDYGDWGHLDFDIADDDLATLDALGVELGFEEEGSLSVKSTSDGSAFPSDLDEVTNLQGVSAYVMGGAFNYDAGMYRTPFEEGVITDDLALRAEGAEANSVMGAPVNIRAHTSYLPGGIPQEGRVPARTWITDNLANSPGSTHDQVIEDAGLRGHYAGTYSDATDGSSSLTIQVFAQGQAAQGSNLEEHLEATGSNNNQLAIALTDGITVNIDTSNYNRFDGSESSTGAVTNSAPPAGANGWTIQQGIPVLYNDADAEHEDATEHQLHFYEGDLPSSDSDWVNSPRDLVSEEERSQVSLNAVMTGQGTVELFTSSFYPLTRGEVVPRGTDNEGHFVYEVELRADRDTDDVFQLTGSGGEGTDLTWEQVNSGVGSLTIQLTSTEELPNNGDELTLAATVSISGEVRDQDHYGFGYEFRQATDDRAFSMGGEAVDISVMGNDRFVSYELGDLSTPENGSVKWVDSTDGSTGTKSARYTPDEGFNGDDNFTYTWLSNGHPVSADVIVQVIQPEEPTEEPTEEPVEDPKEEKPVEEPTEEPKEEEPTEEPKEEEPTEEPKEEEPTEEPKEEPKEEEDPKEEDPKEEDPKVVLDKPGRSDTGLVAPAPLLPITDEVVEEEPEGAVVSAHSRIANNETPAAVGALGALALLSGVGLLFRRERGKHRA